MAGIESIIENKRIRGEDVVITGKKSSLKEDDRLFVNFAEEMMLADYDKQQKHLFVSNNELIKIYNNTVDLIEIKDYKLKKIEGYELKLYPNSTGKLSVSFWKATDNTYFFIKAGGCAVFNINLYGPFKPPFLQSQVKT